MTRNYQLLGTLALILIIGLVGCKKDPENSLKPGVTREGTMDTFVDYIFSNKTEKADNLVCIEEGVSILIGLKVGWQGIVIPTGNEPSNTVRLQGKVEIPAQEVSMICEQLNIQNCPSVGIKLSVGLDEEFELGKDIKEDQWCVPHSTVKNFYDYLIQVIGDWTP